MKNIALFGASGSIGQQTIDIIKKHPDLFKLVAFSVHTNLECAISIIEDFSSVEAIMVGNSNHYQILKNKYPNLDIYYDSIDIKKIICHPKVNFVVNAVVGFAGLNYTYQALLEKVDIAIANKESFVVGGHIIEELASKNGVKIYPIDSEHSAIQQCLVGENHEDIEQIILTASGGPFLNLPLEELPYVTLEMALKHPNWQMGKKISIDSATMVNKGLEIIEAHWLFKVPYDKIKVVIHPTSIVHSLVEFKDGAIKAQLGTPDMRIPIMYALSCPKRLALKDTTRLNLPKVSNLTFKDVDFKRFKAVELAYIAGKMQGSMPCIYNAANEAAVKAFIEGKIRFDEIVNLIELAMDQHTLVINPSIEKIYELHYTTIDYINSLIKGD